MVDTTHTFTFECLDCRKQGVIQALTQLQRRATRMGLEPIHFWFGESDKTHYVKYDENGDLVSSGSPTGMALRSCLCHVTGEIPIFNGWRFVAMLSPTADRKQNLVLACAPDFVCPEQYRSSVGICEHCNTNRRRKDTYLVQHKDGKIIQVGSSCIGQFLDYGDAEKIIRMAGNYFTLCQMNDELDIPARAEPLWETRTFLAIAYRCVNLHGFVSRRKHEETGRPMTSSIVAAHFRGRQQDIIGKTLSPTKDELKKASAIIKSCRGLAPGNNEWRNNLKVIAGQEHVGQRGLGTLASAVPYWLQQQEDSIKCKDAYFGNVGERYTANVTLVRRIAVETFYGISTLHIFRAADGETLKWFTTTNNFSNDQIGEQFGITFTVKKHELYDNQKQTFINRVKVA